MTQLDAASADPGHDPGALVDATVRVRRIGGRFILDRLIGTGPRGAVYAALDEDRGDVVAVKVMALESAGEAASSDNGLRDAAAEGQAGALRVRCLGEDQLCSFVVTELATADSLGTLLAPARPIEPAEVERIVGAIAAALAEVHRSGRTHGNLKPANVFLAADGARFSDFLDILQATRRGSSLEGALRGLHLYMAPEVAAFATPTPAADVFAVGVIGLQMLLGRHPFTSPDLQTYAARLGGGPPTIPAGCPAALRRALRASLAARPGQRPGDGGELCEWLQGGRARRGGRSRAVVAAAAVAACVGTATLGFHAARSGLIADSRAGLRLAEKLEAGGEPAAAADALALTVASAPAAGDLAALARTSAERILAEAAARGDTATMTAAAAVVEGWRGDDPAFRARYADVLRPAEAPAQTAAAPLAHRELLALIAGRDYRAARDHLDRLSGARTGTTTTTNGDQDRRGALRQQANLALSRGEYHAAERHLRALAELDPDDATIAWRLAELEQKLASMRAPAEPSPPAPELPPVAAATSPEAAAGATPSRVRAAVARGDFVAAADTLAADPAPDFELAARVFFNASLVEARRGDCAAARRFADLAARFDDPGRSMSNRRWRERLTAARDCADGRFQLLAEGLALK